MQGIQRFFYKEGNSTSKTDASRVTGTDWAPQRGLQKGKFAIHNARSQRLHPTWVQNMHHVEQTRSAVYQSFGRGHAIHIRFVAVQPTMPPSRADMEIELQIQGSSSTLELCQQFKTSLTAASETLDAAIASTRLKVLGHMTSAQRQSLYEKMQALCENLGALRYKAAGRIGGEHEALDEAGMFS
jgi:hypothetical protein